MTIKFANRVKVSTSTTGTGTITLGSAVNGFQTFSQGGILNGESIRYTIINGNEWEVGTGVYTHSGTTMSRSYEESSTGSLLNLAGDSEVFITVASTDIENIEDTANNALPKAGGTMTGDLNLGDDTNVNFGAGPDLSILSDGTKGVIKALSGTRLMLRSTDSIVLQNTVGSEDMLEAVANAGVTLFYNDDPKIASTSTGAAITGSITVSGTVDGVDIATRDGVLTTTTTTANAALPKAGGTMTGAITFAAGQAFDGRDVSADGSKLDGIESGATGDQTNAEIRAAVEAATDSNVFTDADHTKLNAIEANADVTDTTNVTAAGALMDSEVTNLAQVKAFDSSDYATAAQGTTADAALPKAGGALTGAVTTNSTFDGRDVSADGTKLDGIEANATADQTGAEIKALYEAEANAYTDAKDTKLSGIETGATADQTASEIRTLVESATDSNVFTDADHTKLNGIEASADITDTTNVTAAGALMDSELTNEAAVKAINQGLTTTSDVTFNDVTVSGDLTVSGTTTTVNTETINLADNQILLNSNFTGTTPTENGGIEIERGTQANKTLIWDETNDRWTVGSETFVAGSFVGDGSNLTNVAAASIEVSESADDNVTYNILFSDTDGSGNVQMTPTQDDGGLTYNPALDTLTTFKIQVADSIVHRDDTNTYIDFGSDEIRLVAGGVEFIKLVEGTDDYVRFAQRIYLASDQNIKFEGSTADDFETTLYVVDPTADRTITLPDATGTVALDDVATTSANGLMSSSDKTKLDGIETSADVTDTTNVTAAGALMDSEVTNLAQVKAFDSSDYATAAQGSTADAALPKAGGTMTGAITFDASQTFDAADLTGTLPAINGSNLTNVAASTIEVVESSDTNAFYPILFASNNGSGNVQKSVMQDKDGSFINLSFNPSTNQFLTNDIVLYGEIAFHGSTIDSNLTTLTVTDPTANRTITLPNATGTVALTSDIVTYSNATTSADGLMSSSDKTKLDGIEASADVTDTTNVTAAGALMDSELTDIASVKALNQGVATTDSPTFAALTIDGHTLQDSTNRSGLLQVDTDLGTWNGFSIASTGTSHWSIMGDQDDFGLYDDVNNEWIMLYNENSTLHLYANGTNSFSVQTTGANVNGNLSVTGTVDGRDVATDGTKLDGIESGATADQTAAEILTAIKTVDGSGSGLDADTVDGFHAYYSQILDNRAAGDVTPDGLADKSVFYTFTDDIASSPNSWDSVINVKGWTDSYRAWQLISNSSDSGSSNDNLFFRSGISGTWGSLRTVWDSGNDGSGSGLDADTVDGIEASQFLRSDVNGTMTGVITFAASQTFDAGDLTGTLPSIDGSNLTNVQASSVLVGESADDNATYNVLFSDTTGTGNVQMSPSQDDGGFMFNPGTNYLYVPNISLSQRITHNGDTTTWHEFHTSGQWRVVTGGLERLEVNDSNVTVYTGLKIEKEVTEKVTALIGTSDVLEPQEGTIRTHTLSGNTTYTESFSAGQSMTLMINDGAGYTVTWPTITWVNNGGSAPTLATSGYTVIVLWKVSTTLYGALVGDGS